MTDERQTVPHCHRRQRRRNVVCTDVDCARLGNRAFRHQWIGRWANFRAYYMRHGFTRVSAGRR